MFKVYLYERKLETFGGNATGLKLICEKKNPKQEIKRQSNGQSVFTRAGQSSKYIYRKEWQEKNPGSLKTE